MSKDLKEKIEKLPRVPGVYKFLDKNKKVIYVGKAKDLKARVGSYFQKNLDPVTKTAVLVSKIRDIKYIETMSELEAFILEAKLIREFAPKYNIIQKDDKSYLYIVIRPEKVTLNSKKLIVPKVLALRESDLGEKDIAFGPYADTTTTRYVVRSIRKIFPFRDCSVAKFNRYEKQKQPCLYGHIGLCQAPCTGSISVESYRKEVKRVEKLLSGESVWLLKTMEKEMQKQSKNENFEEAARLRDAINKFEYVRQRSTAIQKYLDNPYLADDLRRKSLQELSENVPVVLWPPNRIECYDISNISGKEAVGSMVVAIEGQLKNSEYRKFKIKRKNIPDDFAMMNEVLHRRLRNDWDMPDLILVDGGKGQVTAALKALDKENLDIPVIGLAKKLETIVYFDGEQFCELNLQKENEGLKVLQRLRDEAHRFAQDYHHKLRLKKIKS